MHQLVSQILADLMSAWRYRWHALVCTWILAVGGWIGTFFVPNRYEANARVYVDTQSVLRPLLSGVAVQPNVDQIVGMMGRTLISRPNIEKVIRMADLDIKLKTSEEREALIGRLMKQLEVKSAGRENLYTIAYADKNPQEAKRVVQSLLTIFVEGSLGDKRKDSDTARRFLDDQLKGYADKLVAAENAVTEFKRRHMGLMPGQGQTFYTRLAEAQAAVNQARLDLKEAETARDAFRRQVTMQPAPSLLEEAEAPESAATESDARIQALQQKLDALRMSYTDLHPDIQTMLRMIEQLKEEKKKELEARRQEAKVRKVARPAAAPSGLSGQLAVSLAESEANVASMQARVAEYERRLNELKAATNMIPQVEAEYTQLTRDYEVTKSNYEKLLSRRESAQISGEMEANAGVIDFRIVDPPSVPPVPSFPNRPLLVSLVLVAALVAGGALAFLLSKLKPTIPDERRLREVSQLPVFGAVVMSLTHSQTQRRRKGLLVYGASFASLLGGYGVLLAALIVAGSRI